jgi:hypothetical protein|tara:strand:- start:26952 stop:27146 length:195 start_codon:yes stop_codon:yes gene_type:complete
MSKASITDPIPKDLFNILACPLCRGNLEYNSDKNGLVCSKCNTKYPIEKGIPILLTPKDRKRFK